MKLARAACCLGVRRGNCHYCGVREVLKELLGTGKERIEAFLESWD
jgi:hypothetical protein